MEIVDFFLIARIFRSSLSLVSLKKSLFSCDVYLSETHFLRQAHVFFQNECKHTSPIRIRNKTIAMESLPEPQLISNPLGR